MGKAYDSITQQVKALTASLTQAKHLDLIENVLVMSSEVLKPLNCDFAVVWAKIIQDQAAAQARANASLERITFVYQWLSASADSPETLTAAISSWSNASSRAEGAASGLQKFSKYRDERGSWTGGSSDLHEARASNNLDAQVELAIATETVEKTCTDAATLMDSMMSEVIATVRSAQLRCESGPARRAPSVNTSLHSLNSRTKYIASQLEVAATKLDEVYVGQDWRGHTRAMASVLRGALGIIKKYVNPGGGGLHTPRAV